MSQQLSELDCSSLSSLPDHGRSQSEPEYFATMNLDYLWSVLNHSKIETWTGHIQFCSDRLPAGDEQPMYAKYLKIMNVKIDSLPEAYALVDFLNKNDVQLEKMKICDFYWSANDLTDVNAAIKLLNSRRQQILKFVDRCRLITQKLAIHLLIDLAFEHGAILEDDFDLQLNSADLIRHSAHVCSTSNLKTFTGEIYDDFLEFKFDVQIDYQHTTPHIHNVPNDRPRIEVPNRETRIEMTGNRAPKRKFAPRMKKLVQKIRPGQNFLVFIQLLLMLAIIGGGIYFLVKQFGVEKAAEIVWESRG